jgi:quercetin dioxygenase-like cupin family protein
MEDIRLGGITIRFLVEEEGVSVFECHVAPGAKVPAPHSHDAFDETIYGLAGTSSFVLDGAPLALTRGDALHIPRGAVHGFVNEGDDAAVFLAVSTPGLMRSAYFTELRDALPDRDKAMQVMRKHGLTPAPPPAD